MTTFRELATRHTWEKVGLVLVGLYPKQESSLAGYEKVLEQLQGIEPIASDWHIVVEWVEDWFDGKPYVHVCGRKRGDDQNWALDFTDWAEWLGMEIAPQSLETFADVEVLAHCLYEMTWYGFRPEDVAEVGRELAVWAGGVMTEVDCTRKDC